MMRLAALGDSFSAGTDGDRAEGVWVRLVAAKLRSQGRLSSLSVHARHGATSGEVIRDQLPQLLHDDTDAVTLVCGANDVLLSPAPDFSEFERNLDLLLERSTALDGVRVFTATYADFSRFLPYRPLSKARVVDGMADVNERIRRLSDRYGARCVDVERGVPPDAGSFAADGLHLSAAGHQHVARLMLAAFGEPADEPLAASPLTQRS